MMRFAADARQPGKIWGQTAVRGDCPRALPGAWGTHNSDPREFHTLPATAAAPQYNYGEFCGAVLVESRPMG